MSVGHKLFRGQGGVDCEEAIGFSNEEGSGLWRALVCYVQKVSWKVLRNIKKGRRVGGELSRVQLLLSDLWT